MSHKPSNRKVTSASLRDLGIDPVTASLPAHCRFDDTSPIDSIEQEMIDLFEDPALRKALAEALANAAPKAGGSTTGPIPA